MAKTYEVTDIKWDVDDEEELDDLPTSVVVSDSDLDDTLEIEDAISEWLSDTYGYCHDGFNINEK